MSLLFSLARECVRRRVSPVVLVTRDPLTDTFNRLAWEAWGRRIRGVGYVAIDLDGFKEVNDERGHAAGDEIIEKIGRILLRHSPRAFRVGGDEFLLLGPPRASSLRLLGKLVVDEVAAAGLGVTASAGIGASHATADAALYAAKRSGRNQVRHFLHTIEAER